jgi:hypothetical protein
MSNYKRLWSVIATSLLVLLSSAASASIIHVNNVIGNDRANGMHADVGTPGDGPVATIRRALEIARGTDSISIANTAVPYEESVTLDRPDLAGSEPYPFIIEGNGALMRGAKRLPPDVWRRVGEYTYRYQPYRKGHYQLAVNGTIADEAELSGDYSVPPLRPLQWCALRGHVYLRVELQKFVDQYEIEAPLYDIGFGLHNARHVVLRNLDVEMYRLDGVAVTGNSRNIRLINIRSTGNGRAGLSVSGTSQVQVGGLDLAGNREAEQLVLLRGRVTELPEAQLPSKPPLPGSQ